MQQQNVLDKAAWKSKLVPQTLIISRQPCSSANTVTISSTQPLKNKQNNKRL